MGVRPIRPPMHWRGALAIGLLAASVSARAALFDDDEARARINALAGRVDQIQRSLEQRLSTLETTVRGQASLDLLSQLDQLRNDLAKLRGTLEVATYELEQAQKRQRDLYVDLDSRLRRLESLPRPDAQGAARDPGAAGAGSPAGQGIPGSTSPPPSGGIGFLPPPPPPGGAEAGGGTGGISGAGTGGARPPSSSVAPPGASSGAADPAAEQRSYDAALEMFRAGNFNGSIEAFRAFVRTHPRSSLAPSAQYWIGNAQYATRDYRSAIATQRQLIASYPDSSKVPDALLNIASCQAELGERAAARRSLEDIVATYPSSDAARIARQRLSALR